MHVIAKRTLRQFWERNSQAKGPLQAWYGIVDKADWEGPADVKAAFGSADFVAGNRIIFNIAGNKYRLVAFVAYPFKRVLIKFVGTHAEYDRINPEEV
jgi:mRNA interferase HigB